MRYSLLLLLSLSHAFRPSSTYRQPTRLCAAARQHRDVVIVGGGLAGLSAALYLTQTDPDRHVTIIDRKSDSTVASLAAAGMLAPNSERLPQGPLLELCLASRSMYADFVELVEGLAKTEDKEACSTGYIASGGFLAPAFAGDSVATWAPPDQSGATWLDAIQVRELEPSLHPDVVGGWWFPEDASVDARSLTKALEAACRAVGVDMMNGHEVTSLDLSQGECKGLWLDSGKYVSVKSLLVANGAWMRQLLPVPIEPHKGQSLSLRMPTDRPPLLRRVLFAQDTYIVPKADGRIVVGATVEAGSYDPNVTPEGILHILTHALELVPGLRNLPIEETWVGLRPTTPDKGPILGKTPWKNLFLAGGYWRNGVLLAPKTGQLLANLLADKPLSPEDERLLSAFSWDRFTAKGGGKKLAASARYAASVHPIHKRQSGFGVAAAVGTELGSYSSARAAQEERQKDRASLWNSGSSDDEFERAAALGKEDATAFSFGDDSSSPGALALPNSTATTDDDDQHSPYVPFEGSADAYTVPFSREDDTVPNEGETPSSDLESVYAQIRANKASQKVEMSADEGDDRPDPGFRIFHVDSATGEEREVPPYTSPGDFLRSLEQESTTELDSVAPTAAEDTGVSDASEGDEYSEKTFDGYQTILKANSRQSREDELEAMRAARRSNRLGQPSIDESKIGAQRTE